MGRERYPKSGRLMIAADGGGSNGSRVRLWKVELQKFADETGLTIVVRHYPPGTSKWNKIEHRLFCHITQNWRGRPLTSRSAVVELIAATTTKTGLTVRCELDTNTYESPFFVVVLWQPEPRPTRPEAIRRLLDEALGKPVDAGSIAAEDLNASNDE